MAAWEASLSLHFMQISLSAHPKLLSDYYPDRNVTKYAVTNHKNNNEGLSDTLSQTQ